MGARSLEHEILERACALIPAINRLVTGQFFKDNAKIFVLGVKRQFAVCNLLNEYTKGPVRQYLMKYTFSCGEYLTIAPTIGMHECPVNTFMHGMKPCTLLQQWAFAGKMDDGRRVFVPAVYNRIPTGEEPPVAPFLWTDGEMRHRVALNGLTELEKERIKHDVDVLQERYNTGWLKFVPDPDFDSEPPVIEEVP